MTVVQSSKSIHSNPLTNVVLANPYFDYMQLKIITYLGEELPGAEKCKCMQVNADGYSLNHCRSWQH
jgi:hypothetical protein